MVHLKEHSVYRTLSIPIFEASTFYSRLKGLMFKKTPLYNQGLWIHPCNSIHMCFMNFPIDVVFLSKNNEIIKLVRNLQPWKFVHPVRGAYSVLELPVKTIEELNLKVGEYIKF